MLKHEGGGDIIEQGGTLMFCCWQDSDFQMPGGGIQVRGLQAREGQGKLWGRRHLTELLWVLGAWHGMMPQIVPCAGVLSGNIVNSYRVPTAMECQMEFSSM